MGRCAICVQVASVQYAERTILIHFSALVCVSAGTRCLGVRAGALDAQVSRSGWRPSAAQSRSETDTPDRSPAATRSTRVRWRPTATRGRDARPLSTDLGLARDPSREGQSRASPSWVERGPAPQPAVGVLTTVRDSASPRGRTEGGSGSVSAGRLRPSGRQPASLAPAPASCGSRVAGRTGLSAAGSSPCSARRTRLSTRSP